MESLLRIDRERLEAIWFSLLECPFCGTQFNRVTVDSPEDRWPEYGILRCRCSDFPIIATIPLLLRGAESARLLALIRQRRYDEAVSSIALPEPELPQLAQASIRELPDLLGIRRLKRASHDSRAKEWRKTAAALLVSPSTTACDLFDFQFRKSGQPKESHYLYFAGRYATPRYLIGLSMVQVIPKTGGPVMDLGCGAGHLLPAIRRRVDARQPVIGVDRNPSFLYVAKRCIAPDCDFVCANADGSLPFRTASLNTVFCSDAFGPFVNKISLVREMKRVLDEKGVLILAFVRNTLHPHKYATNALPADAYTSLFEGLLPHVMLGDTEVLARYLQKAGPDLRQSSASSALCESPTVSLVASDDPSVFSDRGSFGDWPHAAQILTLNPLFAPEGRGKTLLLRRQLPSEYFDIDHPEVKDYLPETVSVDEEILQQLRSSKGGLRPGDVEPLVASNVVFGVPKLYQRPGQPW